MRGRVRKLLVVGMAGPAAFSAVALGEGSIPREGSGGSSSLAGPLVTPASPAQGEEAQAAEQAKLANPDAVAAREASRTEYESLSAGEAAQTASEVFPGVIDDPAGGPPKLPSGQRVVGYPADDAAQIDLGGGKHGVIQSMEPIAVETSPGHHEPLDLSLGEVDGAFQPMRSGVDVRIPKQLGDGVQLASTGVSLTPVDEHGSALGGSEGVLAGATAFYANTQTDSDVVVKPVATGFEEDTLLRSVDSPSQRRYRFCDPDRHGQERARKAGEGRDDTWRVVQPESLRLATRASFGVSRRRAFPRSTHGWERTRSRPNCRRCSGGQYYKTGSY